MRKSHFLFLGYSLKDWNLRVILNRLLGDAVVGGTPGRCSRNRTKSKNDPGSAAMSSCWTHGWKPTLAALAPPCWTRRPRRPGGYDRPVASRAGTLQEAPECPYKGLEAYTEADSDYFFARDSAPDLVVANLMASRLTVLYGPSGVGKSSLLQAGVLPLLRKTSEGAFSYLAVNDSIIVYSASWRDDPLPELGTALLAAVPTPEAITDFEAEKPPLSVELLQDVSERFDADIYLLLDQFEELELYQTDANGKAFDFELGRIIKAPGLPVSVLLGCATTLWRSSIGSEPHVPRILDNKLRLDHLTPSEAREAIEQPLDRYNASVPTREEVVIESALVRNYLTQLRVAPCAY